MLILSVISLYMRFFFIKDLVFITYNRGFGYREAIGYLLFIKDTYT